MVKTLIFYEEHPEKVLVFLTDGDHSRLNGRFVNTVGWEEACEDPVMVTQLIDPQRFFGKPVEMPFGLDFNRDGLDKLVIVHCGFIL